MRRTCSPRAAPAGLSGSGAGRNLRLAQKRVSVVAGPTRSGPAVVEAADRCLVPVVAERLAEGIRLPGAHFLEGSDVRRRPRDDHLHFVQVKLGARTGGWAPADVPSHRPIGGSRRRRQAHDQQRCCNGASGVPDQTHHHDLRTAGLDVPSCGRAAEATPLPPPSCAGRLARALRRAGRPRRT